MMRHEQTKVTALARECGGVYKPLVKFSTGGTFVVQQSPLGRRLWPERFDRYTRHGCIKGNRYAVGSTYVSRADAIKAAQSYMDMRLENALSMFEKFKAAGCNVDYVSKEVYMWGGAAA